MDANPQAVAEPPAEEKPPGRIRHWTKIAVVWIFNSSMSAAVMGAVFLALILAIYHSWTRPPDISTVTNLMKEEVTAGETRNTALVNRIYLQDAIVTDAACQTPGVSRTWQGSIQIDDRYRKLPKVLWLQHVFAQVSWEPNDSHASTAYVTADTVGDLFPASSDGKSQSIVGRELWVFVRVNGQWRIAYFTYNLCFPAYPGA